MSPASQSGASWWIGLDRDAHMEEALKRAPVMSNSREAKSIDPVQGLISTLPKSLVLAKKRLGVAS